MVCVGSYRFFRESDGVMAARQDLFHTPFWGIKNSCVVEVLWSPMRRLQKLKFQFLKGCNHISSQYMTSKAMLHCVNFRSQIWTYLAHPEFVFNTTFPFFRYTNDDRSRLCKNVWSCVSIKILISIVKPNIAKWKCFLENKWNDLILR